MARLHPVFRVDAAAIKMDHLETASLLPVAAEPCMNIQCKRVQRWKKVSGHLHAFVMCCIALKNQSLVSQVQFIFSAVTKMQHVAAQLQLTTRCSSKMTQHIKTQELQECTFLTLSCVINSNFCFFHSYLSFLYQSQQ